MKISYNWLKDLIEIDKKPLELAEQLTSIGLELDGYHETADDTIFDIEVTSNRGDCLSHLGVAREIGAISESRVRSPKSKVQKPEIEDQNLVTIDDADLCRRFTARIVRNVKIGESPEWLKKRLAAIGERPINNVADITNYVMHELGQPMHAFDLDKLAENRIVVRRAKNGEVIKTLDEVERKLDETMLAICDAEKPVAIGGVMGGFDSGISEETTNVLIEVAYFDRDNIRQTSRKLNLTTEASYHFERGVDIENLIRASNRAAELICELAGGEIGEFVDVYPTKFVPNEIESKDISSAVKRLSGLEIETEKCLQILDSLGIKSANPNQNSAIFTAPTWRHDLAIEEDLVEEIVRVYGYNKIGEELPGATEAGGYQPNEMRKKLLRRMFAVGGFDEAISYSFIDTKYDGKFDLIPGFVDENADEKFITLTDAVIEGSIRMRPTLLPELVKAVRVNFNHKIQNIKLFEIGKVFAASNVENDLPRERELLAIVLTGNEIYQNKAMPVRELDFFDAKGAIESAFSALNLSEAEFAAKDFKHLNKGQSAEILFGGNAVGSIGKLSDEISAEYKFKQPIFVAEIDLQSLLESKQNAVAYFPLPKFPAIVRDVSLVAKRDVSFADLRKAIENQNFELLQNIRFVDVYEGKGVSGNERSITIRLEYRSPERTLFEDEIEKIHNEILQNLESDLGASLKN